MVNGAIYEDIRNGRLRREDAPTLQVTLLQAGTIFQANAFTAGTGHLFMTEELAQHLNGLYARVQLRQFFLRGKYELTINLNPIFHNFWLVREAEIQAASK